jgi:hypothetical protein
LLGSVGVKLDTVAQHLSTAGDYFECHGIANTRVNGRGRSPWELEESTDSLGFGQWQRIEAETTFALKAQGWAPFSEKPAIVT